MRKLSVIVFLCCITFLTSYAQRQLWGSASFGGLYGDGFIFKSDSIGDNLEIVHHFQGAVDGSNISALMLASNNKLYGLASSGGQGSTGVLASGTFFEYDLATDQFRVLEHFGPNNTHLPNITTPRAEGVPALTEVSPGVIFGLMRQGRYVFSYNVATGVFTKPFTIPTYQGGASNSTLANQLCEAFYKASDNFLYAATSTNSSCPIANPYSGSIIRVNPANNAISIPHRANCLTSYGFGYNGFFAEANGKLYGTSNTGGINNKGVIFAYNPSDNTYTKLHDFANSVFGYEPKSLVLAKNGKLYGTAHGGGIPEPNLNLHGGGGVLFEFDITTGTFTKKHDFTLTGQSVYDMGIFPSGMISSTNGKLYGTTQYGVFEYDPATSAIRVAGRFEGGTFSPSLVQVCRKPVYQPQAETAYTLCKDAAFSLDLASTNATTVTWKHNNVVDPSKTTTSLSFAAFTAADAGTWVCTMTNECGTTVTPFITLTLDAPAQPVIEPAGPLTICEGETVTLSAPEGFSSYAWSSGETTREIEITLSGDYTVKVNDGCESPASGAVSVTVHPLPPPPGLESPSGTLLVASGSNGTYEWTWNDVPLDEHGAELHATESGTYKVYSVSADGCRSNDFTSLSLIVNATETNADNSVVIYPNPGHGTVNLKVNDDFAGPADIFLFNVTGAVVFRQSVNFRQEPSSLHLRNVPAGLYHLMIRKGENVIHRKIVIH